MSTAVPGLNVHCTRRIQRIGLRERHGSVLLLLDLAMVEDLSPTTRAPETPTIDSKPHDVSFDELVGDVLQHSRIHKTLRNHAADRSTMRVLLEWFGGRLASEITPEDISAELEELAEDGRTLGTCHRYRSLLSLIFSRGIRSGKVSANPAEIVPLPEANAGRVRILSTTEEASLRIVIRETAPEREPELDLALQTGLRRGEQYSLTWGDVNLDAGVLHIRQSKNGNPRDVLLNSNARAAIERLLESNERTDRVCPPQGRWFEAAIQLAGVQDFRWHDLRHTFASRLAMAGVDLRSVQELLGHKSFAITLRYVHMAQGHLQGAVEQLCKVEK